MIVDLGPQFRGDRRTSQEVRELKYVPVHPAAAAIGRTSQEVRELKSESPGPALHPSAVAPRKRCVS